MINKNNDGLFLNNFSNEQEKFNKTANANKNAMKSNI